MIHIIKTVIINFLPLNSSPSEIETVKIKVLKTKENEKERIVIFHFFGDLGVVKGEDDSLVIFSPVRYPIPLPFLLY
jgi:hypothetical protein